MSQHMGWKNNIGDRPLQDDGERNTPEDGGFPSVEQLACPPWRTRREYLLVRIEYKDGVHRDPFRSIPEGIMFASTKLSRLVENSALRRHDDNCLTLLDSELQTGNASIGVLTGIT